MIEPTAAFVFSPLFKKSSECFFFSIFLFPFHYQNIRLLESQSNKEAFFLAKTTIKLLKIAW
jgi:hypothetical protein